MFHAISGFFGYKSTPTVDYSDKLSDDVVHLVARSLKADDTFSLSVTSKRMWMVCNSTESNNITFSRNLLTIIDRLSRSFLLTNLTAHVSDTIHYEVLFISQGEQKERAQTLRCKVYPRTPLYIDSSFTAVQRFPGSRTVEKAILVLSYQATTIVNPTSYKSITGRVATISILYGNEEHQQLITVAVDVANRWNQKLAFAKLLRMSR